MYYYVMEYCEPYQQLMPVLYEKGNDEAWHKVRMACSGYDQCKIKDQCRHFAAAPDFVKESRLSASRIGE
jgi:hypothetical protein